MVLMEFSEVKQASEIRTDSVAGPCMSCVNCCWQMKPIANHWNASSNWQVRPSSAMCTKLKGA